MAAEVTLQLSWRKHEVPKARTFAPWSGTRAAYIFFAPGSVSASSWSRSRSHASPQVFASNPSLSTLILPQLSHPAGTTIRSRSRALGLC